MIAWKRKRGAATSSGDLGMNVVHVGLKQGSGRAFLVLTCPPPPDPLLINLFDSCNYYFINLLVLHYPRKVICMGEIKFGGTDEA